MFTVPVEIQARFEALLIDKGVSEPHRHHYIRWLRYYIDFCFKYNHDELQRESLSCFIEKLKEKHQADFRIRQAAHAVNLFYEIGGSF